MTRMNIMAAGSQSAVAQSSTVRSQHWVAGLLSVFLGAGLVFMVGLANVSAAHNAAHDTRHAIGFPCH